MNTWIDARDVIECEGWRVRFLGSDEHGRARFECTHEGAVGTRGATLPPGTVLLLPDVGGLGRQFRARVEEVTGTGCRLVADSRSLDIELTRREFPAGRGRDPDHEPDPCVVAGPAA